MEFCGPQTPLQDRLLLEDYVVGTITDGYSLAKKGMPSPKR